MSRFLPDEASPPVSIVINTLNRGTLLDDAIRGVFQLDYPDFELIVVNGPSTDTSEQVLQAWHGRIKHLRCDVANLSVSRNVGIAAAAGEIVAFLDDDAVPHPNWLRYLTRHYADPAIGGVGGFTVDNTGVKWQVRKTVCDRFGNACFVDDFFDERSLNFPGTPCYPSLLGTNSSFRRSALREIGGFDHTFAYLLDETDVCLRLVDAGWQVVYEPSALIFHQFAESHIRSARKLPRTLYPSVVSKTYFINRHGQAEGYGQIAREMEAYRDELLRANAWLAEHGDISAEHRASLDEDVEQGTADGTRASWEATASGKSRGDLPSTVPEAFLPASAAGRKPMRVALVSQGMPPENDAGIARWTDLLARGLAQRGVAVHLITRSTGLPSRRFENGIWVHRITPTSDGADALAARYQLPKAGVGHWMASIMREIAFLKTFGLDLVSFPIWDLEALPVLDDPDVASVLSLHTTYRLARPFKREWNERIIYGRQFVDRMVAAEGVALLRAPAILANSDAVVREIEEGYGLSLGERCRVVPHGTPDILARAGMGPADKQARRSGGGPLRVLFAGRFEPRKGHDLALKLAAAVDGKAGIRFDFAGARPDADTFARARAESGVDPEKLGNATFHGEVDRATLDRLFLESDVVLMPSRFESFGLVAIEGMSAGSPVLALANGGLAEIVEDGVSGKLYAEEADFVRRGAELLVRLAGSPDELGRMAAAAHARFLERYSVEAMAAGVAEFYAGVLATRRSDA